MKIKYETDDGWCETFCPNSEKEGIKVGSMSCAECDYFVSDDETKQIVKCSFEKTKNKLED